MRKALTTFLCLMMICLAEAKDMRAAVTLAGGGVQVQSVPIPEPQAGQVRIRVRAASVNPVDWKLAARSGPGNIPGRDMAGIIDAVGPEAGPWRRGQAVFGITVTGSYADYALARVGALAAKPPRMSFQEAAGLGVVGETAWRAIVTVANVQAGQKVLIQGGAGGVGSMAVQIAHDQGAEVFATASANHADFVRQLGAREVIDYRTVRFEDRVHDMDMVLNTVDADTGLRSLHVLKPGGILVSVVGATPAEACAAAKVRCAVTGSVTGEMLSHVGRLAVRIERTFTLDQAAQAWEAGRQGHTAGKMIVEVSH